MTRFRFTVDVEMPDDGEQAFRAEHAMSDDEPTRPRLAAVLRDELDGADGADGACDWWSRIAVT